VAVRMLPTPRASDGLAETSHARTWSTTDRSLHTLVHTGELRDALLQTPTAQLAVNGGSQHPDKRRAGGHGPTLADQVEHLLPKPRATDGTKWGPGQTSTGAPSLPSAVLLPTPAARDGKGRDMPGGKGGRSLPDTLLPTPTVADSRNSRNATAGRSPESTGHPGSTLCDVFWTGEPTGRQSPDGKPSPGGRHPGQLSLDELENDSPPDSSSGSWDFPRAG
jgi:hypothetical protein